MNKWAGFQTQLKQSSLNRISEHVYWLAPDANTDRPRLGAIVGSDDPIEIADAFLAGLRIAG
jgi:hypothetical protein